MNFFLRVESPSASDAPLRSYSCRVPFRPPATPACASAPRDPRDARREHERLGAVPDGARGVASPRSAVARRFRARHPIAPREMPTSRSSSLNSERVRLTSLLLLLLLRSFHQGGYAGAPPPQQAGYGAPQPPGAAVPHGAYNPNAHDVHYRGGQAGASSSSQRGSFDGGAGGGGGHGHPQGYGGGGGGFGDGGGMGMGMGGGGLPMSPKSIARFGMGAYGAQASAFVSNNYAKYFSSTAMRYYFDVNEARPTTYRRSPRHRDVHVSSPSNIFFPCVLHVRRR
jgi:hypothetical protein